MNLPKSIQAQGPITSSLPRTRTRRIADERSENRPNVGEIVLIAGTAAFLITSTLLVAMKTMRQQRDMRRYLGGETTDGLAAAADSIVSLIEQSAETVTGESYPASFPLDIEREQHRMAEAYGRLYRLLGAKERAELPVPEQLLIFRGIAAYEALPAGEALSVTADGRNRLAASASSSGAANGKEQRFVPNAYQLEALNLLYLLCLDIRSLVSDEHRAVYGADRSERSAARLLTAIGQRLT
ncbi:hypothetical protein CDO73_01295 [Saccharibacillus sp. O23]|uniref:hypothetical protein n=1 Tax=Saccharibacillus sp. O23 TaxID=2009338 RepID=UPI000B4E7A1E|nr:hypothetical protein [Saccharibacillus sp. O23]OWR33168.1 hypothetical protein CDO73_01295 [Saccharibacillus sp. O23]